MITLFLLIVITNRQIEIAAPYFTNEDQCKDLANRINSTPNNRSAKAYCIKVEVPHD